MVSNQVMFNLGRIMERFLELQNQTSTNRRINKPSDDPIGTLRDLSYRERLANIEQYQANISVGSTWLSTVLSYMLDFFSRIVIIGLL